MAAIRSPSRPRRSPSATIDRTACASPSATSAASPRTLTTPSAMRLLAQQRVQLVLEAARLDGAVDAALLGRVRLPPPASVARRLARADGPGAGRAADRGVALR